MQFRMDGRTFLSEILSTKKPPCFQLHIHLPLKKFQDEKISCASIFMLFFM